jgi:hypothetical protein
VYASLYMKKGESLKVLKAPALMAFEQFTRLSKGASIVDAAENPADARGVGMAALLQPRSRAIDPFLMEPLYLRPRDCNVTPAKK